MIPYMRKYSNDSRNAALAAWAAWDQGKFWEMHDLLFVNAPELDRPVLDRLARELGLDMVKFSASMDKMVQLGELQENLDRIHDLDIWSTPTVIINGRLYKGAQPYEKYKEAVEEALKGKRSGILPRFWRACLSFPGMRCAHAQASSFGKGKIPLYVEVPRARPTNEPKVGESAPDFTLPSVSGENVTLSSFRGKKNVLLTFLPAAFTPV
jgi:hypothetical protein